MKFVYGNEFIDINQIDETRDESETESDDDSTVDYNDGGSSSASKVLNVQYYRKKIPCWTLLCNWSCKKQYYSKGICFKDVNDFRRKTCYCEW